MSQKHLRIILDNRLLFEEHLLSDLTLNHGDIIYEQAYNLFSSL